MKKKLIAGLVFAAPFLALAQAVNTSYWRGIIGSANQIIGLLIPLVMALAVLIIIWGIFGYIRAAGDEEKRKEFKSFIVWGIIGLAVMVSIWGLVGILTGTFGTTGINAPVNTASGLLPN